jgi:hypothetical protein
MDVMVDRVESGEVRRRCLLHIALDEAVSFLLRREARGLWMMVAEKGGVGVR